MEKSKLLNVSLTYKTNTKNSREIGCFLYNKIYSYKNYAQLFLQGKPLTYSAFFDIIAQNKYFVQFREAKRLKY